MAHDNRWERARREYEDELEHDRQSMPREARVAEGAMNFQEFGLPVAVIAGAVWLVRRVIRRRRNAD